MRYRVSLITLLASMSLLAVQRHDLAAVSLPIGSMRPSEVLAVLAVAVAVMERRGQIVVPFRITFLLIGLLAAMYASSFMSFGLDGRPSEFVDIARPDREVPFVKSFTSILAWLFGLSMFYAVVLVPRTAKEVHLLARVWIAGAVVNAVVAIYSAPASMLGWPLGDAIGVFWRSTDMAETGDSLMPRVRGLTQEPRHLAIFMVSLIPLLFLASREPSGVISRRHARMALGICLAAYLLTLSRSTVVYGAMLTVLFAFVFPLAHRRRRFVRIMGSVVKVSLTLVLVGLTAQLVYTALDLPDVSTFLARQVVSMGDASNLSNNAQELSWSVAWGAFRDYPLLGVGIGNLSFVADRYMPPRPSWLHLSAYKAVVPVNNVYLDMLSETGVIGATFFLAVLVYLAARGGRAAVTCVPERRTLVLGVWGGALLLMAAYVLFSGFFFAYVWATLGMLHLVSSPWYASGQMTRPNALRPVCRTT